MNPRFRLIHFVFTTIGVALIFGGLGAGDWLESVWKALISNANFPFTPHAVDLFGHSITEVGVGFIVAVVVSLLWDLHHRHHVEKRLQQLANDVAKTNINHEKKLEEHCAKITNASGKIERSLSTVLENYAPMVQSLVENDVENVFRRYALRTEHKQELDQRLFEHMLSAIKSAEKFVVLGGRAFNDSLWVKNDKNEGLRAALEERIRNVPGFTVLVLYGSTAHSEESLLLQEYRFRKPDHQDMLRVQRKTLHALFNRLASLSKIEDTESTKLIDVRALTLPPAYWVLATDRCAFFDPYLPFRSPGETFVFKVGHPSNMPEVDIRELLKHCTPNAKGEMDRTLGGQPKGHSFWDSDGELASDPFLYMRILKSFLAQFAVRGEVASTLFVGFLDRNRDTLSDDGIEKWEEIIEAAKAIETKARAVSGQK